MLHTVQVRVTTAKAVYTLGKAAAAYRTIFEHLCEAVAVAVHCHMALTASAGGNPQASLSEVIAKLARAKVLHSIDSLSEILYCAPLAICLDLSRKPLKEFSGTCWNCVVLQRRLARAMRRRGRRCC